MKISTALLIASVSALGTAAPAPARADRFSDQVNQVLLAVFQSLDTAEEGVVRPRESDRMIRLTFGAMDVDHDQRVTPEEFKGFSMGFEYLAQVCDKLPAFNAAKAALFERWDAGNRGHLTLQDYTAGIKGDLTAAAAKNEGDGSQLGIEDFKRVRFIRELTDAIR